MPAPQLRICIIAHHKTHLDLEMFYQRDLLEIKTSVVLPVEITDKDAAHFAWYFEQYPYDPSGANSDVARNIELWMNQLGEQAFTHLFDADENGRSIYRELLAHKEQTQIAIVNSTGIDSPLPFEFIKDPASLEPLFLRVAGMSYTIAGNKPSVIHPSGDAVKILLVISRPKKFGDVPFRSVGKRLYDAIRNSASAKVIVEMLRPPSYAQLLSKITEAFNAGEPYTILHFDGHGIFEDLNAVLTGGVSKKYKGYLLFENEDAADNILYVDGKNLGKKLAASGVYHIVLNACRSAQSSVTQDPLSQSSEKAYSSLAADLLQAGVATCIAMRYNIFVNTASAFMFNFYEAFADEHDTRSAAAIARQKIYDAGQTFRDWIVPAFYQNESIAVDTVPAGVHTAIRRDNYTELGFIEPVIDLQRLIGNDNLFLQLEKCYITGRSVLLQGWPLAGKTYAACAFARWYAFTGGANLLLYTDISGYRNFKSFLEATGALLGINSGSATQIPLQEMIADHLASRKTFWVIDDLHTLLFKTFKPGSVWEQEDLKAIKDFLKTIRNNGVKTLLVESGFHDMVWPANFKVFITEFTIGDTVELVDYIRAKENYRIDTGFLKPLIDFGQLNPVLTLLCIRYCAGKGFQTYEEIDQFIHRIRSGDYTGLESPLMDRLNRYRDDLSLLMKRMYDERQLDMLSMVGLFQYTVFLAPLEAIADPEEEFHLPLLAGIKRDDFGALINDFSRYGLIFRFKDATGYFIHPALPFFISKIFNERIENKYGDAMVRSFTGFFSAIAWEVYSAFIKGDFSMSDWLRFNRFNLLYALDLGLHLKALKEVVGIFLGLVEYYERNGRVIDILRFIKKIEPLYIDPHTNLPLNKDDRLWVFVNETKARIATDLGEIKLADRLLRIKFDFQKEKVTPLLLKDFKSLTPQEQTDVSNFQVGLGELSLALTRQKSPEAPAFLKENYELAQKVNDPTNLAISCSHLGIYYIEVAGDGSKAFEYFKKGFDHCPETNTEARGAALVHMGRAKILMARNPKISDKEYGDLMTEAESYCLQGLSILPSTAAISIAHAHLALGIIYSYTRALLPQAQTRLNTALSLYKEHRYLSAEADTRYELIKVLINLGDVNLALVHAFHIVNNADQQKNAHAIKFAQEIIDTIKPQTYEQ